MTNILTNDLVYISIISGIVCLTTAYYIKFKFFNSQNINTSNTPNSPELNFTQRELNEIRARLERGEQLNPEIDKKLEQDLQTIMGEDSDQFIHTLNFYKCFKTILKFKSVSDIYPYI